MSLNHHQPQIRVVPEKPLVDERVAINVDGLPPSQLVTIRASMVDDNNSEWTSEASFVATPEGRLDLSKQPPQDGDYSGADAMGLIWSMKRNPSADGGSLFAKTRLEPTRIKLEVVVDNEAVAGGEILQRPHAEDVRRIEVRDQGLRGTLFLPHTAGLHRGVIVIGGSGGGLQEGRAALLASHGFAALALAYFAFEDLPKHLVDIPLEYFASALEWMLAHAEVDSRGIALIGGSRGGEGVLLLGSTFPHVCAVVANVPSHVIWQGLGDPQSKRPCYAWTLEGKGLEPMASFGTDDEIAKVYSQDPIPLTPLFEMSLANAGEVEKASIPVEQIRGPVLLVSGADDAMWPSATMATAVADRLKAKHFGYPVTNLVYENAGHLILPPYRPTAVNAAPHPVDGNNYAFGGTPEGNALAGRDSWEKTLAFLEEVFRN